LKRFLLLKELGEGVSIPHSPEGSSIICDNRKRHRRQEYSGADEEQDEENTSSKRQCKNEQTSADDGEPEERTNGASAYLQTPLMLKTLERLKQQPQSERRDGLLDMMAQWKSACAERLTKHSLRNTAREFNINITRETQRNTATVSKAIGEAIIDRVNALHRDNLHAANQIEGSGAGEPIAEAVVAVTASDQRERKRKTPDGGDVARFLVPKNECSDNYEARSVTTMKLLLLRMLHAMYTSARRAYRSCYGIKSIN